MKANVQFVMLRQSKVKNITKAVAEAWRTLSREERTKYEDMARRDKERYDLEKANYSPPPGVSLTSKRPRDPTAPKYVFVQTVCHAKFVLFLLFLALYTHPCDFPDGQ